jgi:hypothetical protein
MDASKDDERASLLCKTPDSIPPQRISGVYPNADDIACIDRVQLKRLERLVTQDGIPKFLRCSCR